MVDTILAIDGQNTALYVPYARFNPISRTNSEREMICRLNSRYPFFSLSNRFFASKRAVRLQNWYGVLEVYLAFISPRNSRV